MRCVRDPASGKSHLDTLRIRSRFRYNCLNIELFPHRYVNVLLIHNAGDPRISILEDRLPDGVRSTLIIREAHDKNFGAYNCSVTNSYGMDAAEIVLRKQSNFPFIQFDTFM